MQAASTASAPRRGLPASDRHRGYGPPVLHPGGAVGLARAAAATVRIAAVVVHLDVGPPAPIGARPPPRLRAEPAPAALSIAGFVPVSAGTRLHRVELTAAAIDGAFQRQTASLIHQPV